PSGLSNSWGIAYNPFTADLWLQDYRDNSSPIDDDQLVRFLSDGTYTGDAIALTHTSNYFAADMTFNPVTGSLWQPGRDRCIHEYDLTSRQPTGETICTPANRTEALVYDPMTDTYIGSQVDQNTGQFSFLYRFGTDGAILETTVINWVIQGMAFNPANGHLITSGGSGGHPGNFQVLDANNHFSYVDSIWTPGFLNAPYGMDLACGGSLWVVVYDSPLTIYEIASGESGVCDWMDIPWLSESSPSSGTIAAMADQTVSLTFDAAGLMPGTYTAQLDVAHNTPYAFPRLPVSLTVTLAAGYGELTGNVTALERCALDPDVLPDALVEILSGDNVLYTTHTDATGQYYWASADPGEYTVRISADGYVTQTDTFPLVADLTATRDFALRSAAPCITSSATSLSAEVDQNSTQIVNFTLLNSGAVSGDFELNELPAGGLPAAPAPELLLNEGFEAVAFP
ncbi:carboxypeptidase regulatory-like domain-containing protein, partial [bacterium]